MLEPGLVAKRHLSGMARTAMTQISLSSPVPRAPVSCWPRCPPSPSAARRSAAFQRAASATDSDAARVNLWEWFLETNSNYWSDETGPYGLGSYQSCTPPSYDAFGTSVIHPDDRDRVERIVATASASAARPSRRNGGLTCQRRCRPAG